MGMSARAFWVSVHLRRWLPTTQRAPGCCRCAAPPSRARGLQPMTAAETVARFPGGFFCRKPAMATASNPGGIPKGASPLAAGGVFCDAACRGRLWDCCTIPCRHAGAPILGQHLSQIISGFQRAEPFGRRRHFPWRNCAAVSIGEELVPLDTKQGLCLRHKPLSSCGG